ncbi:DNA-binding protein reb1 [Cyphellophora attinorum]|uniref:DNA-binding protein reb1 n=1 Tax=Cyphellophora attinorum TaxID=1664694 RepID=A0A0N1NWH4_9EURO|nr:DNA-binding protein reb1 [Phialophora attinorum]KPI35296.1 DNA-binding protein reb1 [Phialophora attinorum]
MGNEQSHESASGSGGEGEEAERFDLSAIEDTRRSHRLSPPPPPTLAGSPQQTDPSRRKRRKKRDSQAQEAQGHSSSGFDGLHRSGGGQEAAEASEAYEEPRPRSNQTVEVRIPLTQPIEARTALSTPPARHERATAARTAHTEPLPELERGTELPQAQSRPSPRTLRATEVRKAQQKPRANSSKKRRGTRRVAPDESSSDAEPVPYIVGSENEPPPEPEAELDDATRLAEEILIKEAARRVREREPEMFSEYAMSDESDVEIAEVPIEDAVEELAEAEEQDETASETNEPVVHDSEPDHQQEESSEEEQSDSEDADDEFTGQVQDVAAAEEILQTVAEDVADAHEPNIQALPEDEPSTDEEAQQEDIDMNDDAVELDPGPEEPVDHTTTSASNGGFDTAPETELIKETPVARSLKRKHGFSSPAKKVYSLKKRRRETPASPNTQVDSDDDETFVKPQRRSQPAKRQRQSSMDLFAQPYTKESGLRHPVYHPEAPKPAPRMRVEVVVPLFPPESLRQPQNSIASLESSRSGLKQRNKSSHQQNSEGQRGDLWDVTNQPDRSRARGSTKKGIARTIAKRWLGQEPDDSSTSSSGSTTDFIDSSDNEQQFIFNSPKSKKRQSKGKGCAMSNVADVPVDDAPPETNGHALVSSDFGDASTGNIKNSSKKRLSRGEGEFRCPTCNVRYASQKTLNHHMKSPDVHANLFDCQDCDERFLTKAGLERHAKEKGHEGAKAQGVSGKFSVEERAAIARWRDDFCKYHGINLYEFNDMMTASCRKGNEAWSYNRFTTKEAFLQEYYDVLPERDQRAMRRYRTNFQNVDLSNQWSAQDDQEMRRLVGELGQKWLEIGEKLTRDPEACRQRWRTKLALGDKQNNGEWSTEEKQRFDDAIVEIQKLREEDKEVNVETFNWAAVSQRVETPSAGKAKPRVTPGKSRMASRLSGTPGKAGKKLSTERVEDSDNEVGDDTKENVDEPTQPEAEQNEKDDEAFAPRFVAVNAESEYPPPEGEDDPSQQPKRPALSRTKTPTQRMTATQAFDATQADTSALRSSGRRKRNATPSQEQPSPGIPLQHRPSPSPEFRGKLSAILDDPSNTAQSAYGPIKSSGAPATSDAVQSSYPTLPDTQAEVESSLPVPVRQSKRRRISDNSPQQVQPAAEIEEGQTDEAAASSDKLKDIFEKHSRKAKAQAPAKPKNKRRRINFLESDEEDEADGGEIALPA